MRDNSCSQATRRGFIGGFTAFFALQSGLARAAGKVEKPLLRLGIVSDIHIRTDSDPDNPKTWGHASNHLFEKALTSFRKRGTDAVVVPGDFTEYGAIKELEASAAAWKRVFAKGDKDDFGNPVEKLFVRGNHDKMGKDSDLDLLIRKDPPKVWKDVFGIDWYDKVMLRKVRGFTFVLADWGVTRQDLDDFFAAHGGELPKDKPFFYVQHAPPRGTVDKPQDGGLGSGCGGDNADCSRHLKKFPNCIALTGHSHFSITLGDQTWQDDYLSIGCGCLQYMWNREGRDNSWCLPRGGKGHAFRCPSGGHQGLFLTVYANRVVVERLDVANDEKVGPDHVFPLDGSKPYSFGAQRKRARAPQFAKGAEAVASERDFHYRVPGEKWIDERQVIVTVPRAAECPYDEGRVYEYECVAFDAKNGSEAKPLLVRRVLAQGYFLNDARVEKKTIIAFGRDEFPAKAKLRFAVRPMDDWGNRGQPIYASWDLV